MTFLSMKKKLILYLLLLCLIAFQQPKVLAEEATLSPYQKLEVIDQLVGRIKTVSFYPYEPGSLFQRTLQKLKDALGKKFIQEKGPQHFIVQCEGGQKDFSSEKLADQALISQLHQLVTFLDGCNTLKKFLDVSDLIIEKIAYAADPEYRISSPADKKIKGGKDDSTGLWIRMEGDLSVVAESIETQSAFKAGIRSFDQIVAVNGQSTQGKTLDQVLGLLKGLSGTQVALDVLKIGTTTPQKFTLIRETHVARKFEWRLLDKKVGYIQVPYFMDEMFVEKMKSALDDLKKKGMKTLILDLRDSRGGLLDIASNVAALFLSKEKIVYSMRDRTGQEIENQKTYENGTFQEYNPLLLVNHETSTGAEIIAVALRENIKSKIIGEKTNGNGSIQSYYKLPHGYQIGLTIAQIATPSGYAIQNRGLEPDVVMEDQRKEKGNDPILSAALKLAAPQKN